MRHGKTLHSLLLLLVLGDLLHSAVARAQARCPWLNVATASGVLEGPALLAMPKSTENFNPGSPLAALIPSVC